jgi:hypothetical protein
MLMAARHSGCKGGEGAGRSERVPRRRHACSLWSATPSATAEGVEEGREGAEVVDAPFAVAWVGLGGVL